MPKQPLQLALLVLTSLALFCGQEERILAQTVGRVPGHYRYDVWTTEQGLPQNSVNTLVQTRDGYLWVGTFGA